MPEDKGATLWQRWGKNSCQPKIIYSVKLSLKKRWNFPRTLTEETIKDIFPQEENWPWRKNMAFKNNQTTKEQWAQEQIKYIWKCVYIKEKSSRKQIFACFYIKVEVLVSWSCLALRDLMDCSLPGSSLHGILQARILEWVAIPFSRDLPNPGIEPGSPALQADTSLEPPGKPGFILKNLFLIIRFCACVFDR